MSSNNSALASLTATYTDSENEDDHDSNSDSLQSTSDSEYPTSTTTSPKQKYEKSPAVITRITSSKSTRRLVSYNDDNVISDDDDDENVSPNMETVNMEISADEDEKSQDKTDKNNLKIDQFAEYGFSLPAEPKGTLNPCTQNVNEFMNFFT